MLREAPIGTNGLRAAEPNRPDTGSSDPGSAQAEGGTSVRASPPAETALRRRLRRAGPGFGPGAAKPADPGFRSMDAMAAPRLRPRIPPGSDPRPRPRDWRGGKRSASSKAAERRTVRASALSGSQRENRAGLGRPRTPEEAVRRTPGSTRRHSKPPNAGRLASQARFQAKGQWGPAATPAPITVRPSPSPPMRRPNARKSPRPAALSSRQA